MLDKMGELRRTNYCTDVSESDIGKVVCVAGFTAKQRDKGNLIFIDLRDRTGIIQLTFDDTTDRGCFNKAKTVRAEYVLMASGVVCKRESINPDIKTGMIEIMVNELKILSVAQTPPFHITDNTNVNEELRLKYRYLDLRRDELQRSMMLRHKIAKAARDYYDEQGFIEIETPILMRSTPEGARDYLVPSRVHKGSFYALPQSPQQYKQLTMLAGFDRYMQIARCFRDEDLRADRQPEFTQIDLEMSFVTQEEVLAVNEGFVKYLFKKILDVEVATPLKRLTYNEAMSRYGSDKPDTRFGLELVDLSEVLKDTEFKVFATALQTGAVMGINAKGLASQLARKKIDKLVDVVKTYKASGLAFTKLAEDSQSSSYEKFLSDDEVMAVRTAMNAQISDVILIVADKSTDVVYNSLGALRLSLAREFNMIEKDTYDLLWVTDFPLFEFDEEENRYVAKHHPFTAVQDEDIDLLLTNPSACRAKAYDLILNGCELGGGSIRISDPELQQNMFKALGFSEEKANEQFGFLINAFKYGAPPHGGMAYGLDRLCMLMSNKESIRDVIAFPKVQNASELMTNAPGGVDEKQLEELGISLIK